MLKHESQRYEEGVIEALLSQQPVDDGSRGTFEPHLLNSIYTLRSFRQIAPSSVTKWLTPTFLRVFGPCAWVSDRIMEVRSFTAVSDVESHQSPQCKTKLSRICSQLVCSVSSGRSEAYVLLYESHNIVWLLSCMQILLPFVHYTPSLSLYTYINTSLEDTLQSFLSHLSLSFTFHHCLHPINHTFHLQLLFLWEQVSYHTRLTECIWTTPEAQRQYAWDGFEFACCPQLAHSSLLALTFPTPAHL